MEQKPQKMEKCLMVGATGWAKRYYDEAIERAQKMADDADREKRLQKSLCKACHYLNSRVGGQALTDRPCMCCGENQVYSSTYTDVLCLACAVEGSLCKHCGGDLEMRVGRRKWPEPKIGEQSVRETSNARDGENFEQ